MPIFSNLLPKPEILDAMPLHEGPSNAQSTYVALTTLDGGSYVIRKPIRFNRCLVRLTAATSAPTLAMSIYQAADGGGAATANRVATMSAVGVTATTITLTVDEGTVLLKPGIIHVLYGRASGSGTFTTRTYLNVALDLLNQNVDSGSHKITFTTALAASGVHPTTLAPLTDCTASILDVAPIIRFKKV